jgi:hypothetical protein
MIETKTYRDGGSISIFDTETKNEYIIDYRIGTETEGRVFLGYPTNNRLLNTESYSSFIDMLYKEYLNDNIVFTSTRQKDVVDLLILKYRSTL